MVSNRDKNGKFIRTIKLWSLKNFNDGYMDSKGRFRVFSPDNHRAGSNGYVLRSLVAWETYHEQKIPKGLQIHHKNGNKLDDSKDNLLLVTTKEHGKLHRYKEIEKVCLHCKKIFTIKKHRLNSKKDNRGIFCSQKCYHKHPRKYEHIKAISNGLKKAYKEGRRRSDYECTC